MSISFPRRWFRPLFVLATVALFPTPLIPAPPATVTVSISPTTATLAPGGSRTFTATVSGTTNTAVTWSYTGGSIQGTGSTVTYTAPATTGNYTVTATSVATTTKKATATVTVSGPVPFPKITISPACVMVGSGQSQAFTATLTGMSSTAVGWRMANGYANYGTLSSNGTYVAGSYASVYGEIYHEAIEAYSLTDPSVVARAVVGVLPTNAVGPVAVTIPQPQKLEFVEGESVTFQATVTGATDTRVEWERADGANFGGNGDGVISVLGAFTARNPFPWFQGERSCWITLRAVSLADRTKWAYLQVRVWRKGAVNLNPGSFGETVPFLTLGSTLQLAAEVKGGGSVSWSLVEGGGTVSPSGLYTAPTTYPSAWTIVRASNAADPTSYSEVQIPLAEPGAVTLSGDKWAVLPGGKLTFKATTAGTNEGVTWGLSLDGVTWTTNSVATGSISKGTYTAPASISPDAVRKISIRAVNAKNSSKSASGELRVEYPLEAASLRAPDKSWPDTYWTSDYGWNGSESSFGFWPYVPSNPSDFWGMSGSGTILGAWYDSYRPVPNVRFKTGAPGTITLSAYPRNGVSSLTVSKVIQVVPVPDLSGVYSNGINNGAKALRVLDFGTKNVIRPDGQSASMHRLWSTWSYLESGTWKGMAWRGRKLSGPGLVPIYSGYDAWGGAPDSGDRNFAVDGLSLSDPSYKRTTDIIIGVEPADFVVDGNWAFGPSIVYLKTGQTLQLQAAVGGTTDKGVTWSCEAGHGSVSSTGLYTAPATPGTYTVTATAQAYPNPSYGLKVRVGTMDNAGLDKVVGSFSGSVLPLPQTPFGQPRLKLYSYGTDLAMEVDDSDLYTQTVTPWIIGGIRGCSAYFNNGTRAVFDPQADGSFLPQAEYSRQNLERVAFSNPVRLTEVAVGILPRINYVTDPILTGATRTFSAQVLGTTNTAVTWSAGSYNAYLTISGNSVVFTGPPVPAGYTYLDIPLKATSVADSTKFDTMNLRIKPVPVTAVTPATATINAAAPIYNSYQNFTASFPTQPSHDAFWSVQEGAVGGSINGLGQYAPGTTPGTYHVVATSQWDPTLKAQATVTVVEGNPYASVTATPGTINSGQSVTVSWTDVWALNTPNPRLTLSIEDWVTHTFQTIDVTGQTSYVFSPAHTSMGTLIITSASGKTGERSSGWINVQSSAVIQSFTANPAFIRYGDPVTLTAVFTGTNGKLFQYINGIGTIFGPITSGQPIQIPAGSAALLNAQPKFSLRCEDAYGNALMGGILTVPCAPAIQSFTATPAGIVAGSGASTTLAWGINSAGLAATVTLKARTLGGVETTYTMGSLTSKVVAPTETTDYTLTVATTAGGESKVLRVRVAEVAALSLTPATTSLAPGATTTFIAAILAAPGKDGLSWTTTKGTLSGGGTSVTYQAPQEVGTYTVTVSSVVDPSLTATATVTVLIGGPGGGGGGGGSSTFDITSFTAGPSAQGADHRLLSWSTVGATGLSLRDSNGVELDVTGTTFMDVVPSGTTIYTLTATDGKTYISRTVTVAGEGYAIAITPTKVTMFANTTFRFGTTLYAPSNRVSWSCDAGSLSQDGTYTPPAMAGIYTVTAALVDDPTKTSMATVTVNEISLQIEPGFLTLPSGQSFGFGYEIFSLTGDTPTWSASAGSILPNGMFTAPLTPGLVTITLTSSKDTTKFATATVDVKPIDVMVFPSSIQMQPQGQYQFSAGTSLGGVTWSVVEAAGGSISNTGLYTAPNEVGTYTVKAKSLLDPTRFGTARVVVATTGGDWGPGGGGGGTGSPVNNGVSVDPPMQTLDAGAYTALNATVLSSEDQRVTWEIAGNDIRAKVDDQGVFNAHEPGIYTVVATSVANAALKGTAILEVRSSVHGLEGIPAALDLEGYSVTVLKDGKVLIAGGQDTRVYDTDPVKGYRGTAYLYDPDTKAFAQVGNLLQARAGHVATLLSDGKVLIAGGMGFFYAPGGPTNLPEENLVNWGELYNPATGLFEALAADPAHPSFPNGHMRTSHSDWAADEQAVIQGAAARLGNGQVLVIGGPDYKFNPSDVYDPTFNQFDQTNIVPDPLDPEYRWVVQEAPNSQRTYQGQALVALEDGRALLTGGRREANSTATPPEVLNLASIFDATTQSFVPLGQAGQTPRAAHTATRLANGRILIIGGVERYLDGTTRYLAVPTATAEVYDPATGLFTPTGSMKWPRAEHAAILLPTGQVMVMGGWTSVSEDATGIISQYPSETEIYDPDTGTFELMDSLAFGLDRPKLALMKDGGVFVAGKPIITASAGTPAAGVQEKGSRSVRSVIAPQTLSGLGGLQAVLGTLSAATLEVDYVTENQGVERYLNDENTRDGKPETQPLLKLWKKDVPSIAYRPAKIDVYFKSNHPMTLGEVQKLKARIRLFAAMGDLGQPKEVKVDLVAPYSVRYKTSFILNEQETLPGAKIRIILDPAREIYPSSLPLEKTTIESDPKWKTRASVRFRIVPIRYVDSAARTTTFPNGIDIQPPPVDAAMVQGFKNVLMRLYPVSTAEYMGSLPETVYDYIVGTPSTITGRPVRVAINSGTVGTVPGWFMLRDEIEKKRSADTFNDDTLYIGLVAECIPQFTNGTMNGMADLPDISNIDVRNISSIFRDLSLTDTYYSPMPHEVGHSFNRLHAPTPANLPSASAPGSPDPNYPYTRGRLGTASSFDLFDVVSKTSFSTIDGLNVEYDLMGYRKPRWVSDYTYGGIDTMHQQFIQIARPAAALILGTSAQLIGQTHENLLKTEGEPSVVLGLRIDSSDKVFILDIGPRKSKQKIIPNLVGEYLFRALGVNGKCYETRFDGRESPHGGSRSCTIAIPDPESWIGYSILHGEKVLYTERFKVPAASLSRMKPMSLKVKEKPGQGMPAEKTTRVIDWGGTAPNYAWVRVSWDEGKTWEAISNFYEANATLEIPKWILEKNAHPIVEVHAQYGFVERVQKFVWDDPGK